MQIILLDKVVNLGNLGEIVKVKDGYARNFLIPSGRARRATEANKAEFEAKRVELEKAAAAKLAEAQAQGEKLGGTTVKLTQKAGVDGRLFGSVTNHDIAEELNKQGYKVVKAQVRMPNGPIKVVSESTVSVALHTDVVVDCDGDGARRNRLTDSPATATKESRLRAAFLFVPVLLPRGQRFHTHLPTGSARVIHRLVQ
ncbi:MAG: 50S ribosomal protein L9 [Acidovorax sp.]|nr:50S ribosomal protein L9 [Acidovorax sp.]